MTDNASPAVEFLLTLHKMDKQQTTTRDVILLYAIMTNPGCNGQEIARKIGIAERSSIQFNIDRLMRHGFVEDRRTEIKKTIPNRLYATPAGLAFWNEIKP
jgi:DNA-binding MarR family transcriptional regulator